MREGGVLADTREVSVEEVANITGAAVVTSVVTIKLEDETTQDYNVFVWLHDLGHSHIDQPLNNNTPTTYVFPLGHSNLISCFSGGSDGRIG